MSVIAATTPLVYTNLGMRGIVEGNPDGFFSALASGAGDATGGTHTVRILRGPTAAASPVDILMRLDSITAINNHTVAIANMVISFTNTNNFLLGSGGGIVHLARVLSFVNRSHFIRDFAEGMWTWPQKSDSATYMSLVLDNVDTAVVSLHVQGRYWYAGPRRLAAMELRR